MKKFMRCPKCRESEQLTLIEIHDESGTTEPGRIYVDEHGSLVPPSIFYFNPGDSTHVEIHCESCDHFWTPRRRGGITVSTDSFEEHDAISRDSQ